MSEEKEEGRIEQAEIEQEMKSAYIDYAMSVIVARALPAAEDGLKPVQRRILFTMHQMGLSSNKQTKKCARVVGECMGKYHPHGDAPIYEALARMAQPFSLRYPLVYGQGNFGSIDGDPPAAMRYTEAKLMPLAEELLQDLEKETVKMHPNFDNSTKEPGVLPAKIPNLLLNGASGIAVGMQTSIPPHNLNEVVDAIIAFIKKPEISVDELMNLLKGPDFPTGGYVYKEGLKEIYEKGKGFFVVRGKAELEQLKGREQVVITELPYQVNKAELIQQIAKLIQSKRIPDVADLRDESAKEKIRIVLQLRKGANSKLIINRLYKLTPLETKFYVNMLALWQGQPRVLGLKQLIECYVKHRQLVVKKRTQFELQKAQERLELIQGLLVAIQNLKAVIELIKKAKHVKEAEEQLAKKFNLTQKQAQAILDMKLQRLTALEQTKLKKDFQTTKEEAKKLKELLSSDQAILELICKELIQLKHDYGDQRKTRIIQKLPEVKEVDLIKKEPIAVLLTAKGYIKSMPLQLYREQHRGGQGISGAELTSEDFLQSVFTCSTHDSVLFLTQRGKLYMLKAYQIPLATRYSKGKALVNLLQINEKVKAVVPLTGLKGSLLFVTKKGIGKQVNLEEFKQVRKSGVTAIKLPLEDELVAVKLIQENDAEAIVATKKGMAVRFSVSEIRQMGKAAYGVKLIKLSSEDEVVGLEVIKDEQNLFTITENGYGKCSKIIDYRKTGRACKGIKNINCSTRTGLVKAIALVQPNDSIIVSTQKGMIIRVPCKDIRVMSRATQGVRIIKLKPGDVVAGAAKVVS